jgi:hypothetical protein
MSLEIGDQGGAETQLPETEGLQIDTARRKNRIPEMAGMAKGARAAIDIEGVCGREDLS